MDMRLEKDSIGELHVPADAYYGVQSLRGAQNFRILEQKLNPYFIKNIARIKKAAAEVNFKLGDLSREMETIQQEIQNMPMAKAMQQAQQVFAAMMQAVNAELSKVLAPEHDSCSGDCHSCGGHCHH